LFGAQNSRKAFDGRIAALLDPDIWTSIEQREKKLRDAIAANPKWKSTRSAYDRIKKSAGGNRENGAAFCLSGTDATQHVGVSESARLK